MKFKVGDKVRVINLLPGPSGWAARQRNRRVFSQFRPKGVGIVIKTSFNYEINRPVFRVDICGTTFNYSTKELEFGEWKVDSRGNLVWN